MQVGVESRAVREEVGSIEVLARPEDAAAVAHADFHLALQDEDPLRRRRAMPLAAEAHRAVAQLIAGGGEHLGEHRLRVALAERDRFLLESRAPIGVAVEHDLGEVHARYFSSAFGWSAMPWPGRSGMRIRPSLHSGSASKRSGGAQSMNSTRKPFDSAPTT